MKHISIICILSLIASLVCVIDCQRVAPGVHPQHYQPNQQHNQQQQYQQPPQHQQQQYQQPPQHQQQHQLPPNVNPQQYNQQVPVQQVDHNGQFVDQHQQQQQQHHAPQHPPQAPVHQQPQAGGHHHDHHGGPQQVLNAANIQHEAQHIAEHMEVPIDTSKMTDQELQFHYFKMHDADNNNKLDGCELIKSLIHWHAQGSKEQANQQAEVPQVEEKNFSDEELTALIDPILTTDDISQDGFIDYPEFIRAQQKSAAQGS